MLPDLGNRRPICFMTRSFTFRGYRGGHITVHIRNKSNDVKFLREYIINCDFLIAFDRGFCLFITPVQTKQNPSQWGWGWKACTNSTAFLELQEGLESNLDLPSKVGTYVFLIKLRKDPNSCNADYKINWRVMNQIIWYSASWGMASWVYIEILSHD